MHFRKGHWKRPSNITVEEENLRYKLAFGKITEEEFNNELQNLKEKRADKGTKNS